jgi:hypothetical protein
MPTTSDLEDPRSGRFRRFHASRNMHRRRAGSGPRPDTSEIGTTSRVGWLQTLRVWLGSVLVLLIHRRSGCPPHAGLTRERPGVFPRKARQARVYSVGAIVDLLRATSDRTLQTALMVVVGRFAVFQAADEGPLRRSRCVERRLRPPQDLKTNRTPEFVIFRRGGDHSFLRRLFWWEGRQEGALQAE